MNWNILFPLLVLLCSEEDFICRRKLPRIEKKERVVVSVCLFLFICLFVIIIIIII